jgi:aspartate/methionine/tyrosine aminotransferase
MDFRTMDYLHWVKTTRRARVNLCRSGVPDCRWTELGLDTSSLEIEGDHPYDFPPLTEAIAHRYGVKPENVVTTLGTSMALFMTGAALLGPGDEVLIEMPTYEPLVEVPRALGARPLRLRRRFEAGYDVDPAEFRRQLSSKVKLVMLTNIHNPSGARLTPSRLAELAVLAERVGAPVLVDEVYLEFLGEDPRSTSFHLAQNIIVVSSLTKVFGLGGLRCGWILAPAALASKLRTMKDYLFVEDVFLSQLISARLFPALDRLRDRHDGLIGQNRMTVREFIRKEMRLSWVEPAAGIVCFPRLEIPVESRRLAELVQDKYETSIVPGDFFGAPRHFRLGYHVEPELLGQGLTSIERGLDELRNS